MLLESRHLEGLGRLWAFGCWLPFFCFRHRWIHADCLPKARRHDKAFRRWMGANEGSWDLKSWTEVERETACESMAATSECLHLPTSA